MCTFVFRIIFCIINIEQIGVISISIASSSAKVRYL